jgi:hypothetical protein
MASAAPKVKLTGPMLEVEGLTRYFDVSPPLLNRVLEGKGRL